MSGQHNTPQVLPLGKERRYWFTRRVGEPWNRPEWYEEVKELLSLPEFEPRVFQLAATTDAVISS